MTERRIGVEDVASGAGVADFRARERSVGGSAGVEQYLIPTSERVAVFAGVCCTFRNTGVAVANTNLASLFNKTGSGVLVVVKRLEVLSEFSPNSGTIRSFGVSLLTTAPSTGTLHTPLAFDGTHDADVEFRGASSADGVASAITATPTAYFGRGIFTRAPSAVEQRLQLPAGLMLDADLRATPDDFLILREGQGLLVTAIESNSSSGANIVQASWVEYTLP